MSALFLIRVIITVVLCVIINDLCFYSVLLCFHYEKSSCCAVVPTLSMMIFSIWEGSKKNSWILLQIRDVPWEVVLQAFLDAHYSDSVLDHLVYILQNYLLILNHFRLIFTTLPNVCNQTDGHLSYNLVHSIQGHRQTLKYSLCCSTVTQFLFLGWFHNFLIKCVIKA